MAGTGKVINASISTTAVVTTVVVTAVAVAHSNIARRVQWLEESGELLAGLRVERWQAEPARGQAQWLGESPER